MSESKADQAIPEVEAELEDFTAQLAARRQEVRDLRARENPAEGVFLAQEIFTAQQDVMRLEVEVELRRKKINRLRLGIDDTAPPVGGFLF